MSTARDIQEAADAHILERIRGGAVKRYSMADGQRIEKDDLEEVAMIADRYGAIADNEDGGLWRTDFELIPTW